LFCFAYLAKSEEPLESERQEKVSFLEVKIFVVVFRQKKMAFKEVAIFTRFPQKLCCVFCVCEKATKVSL
jgi:hypothetical protein